MKGALRSSYKSSGNKGYRKISSIPDRPVPDNASTKAELYILESTCHCHSLSTLLLITIMQDPIVCSICKKDQTIITDEVTGEIVCSKCGLVISDKIQDTRQEWRDFLNTEEARDRRRTGMPTSLARYDMGLSTIIARTDKDASGQVLDASMRSTMGRLRTWDLRTQPSANRNLGGAFNQLNTLKDKLGLPDVIIEKTAYLYRKALKKGLIRRSSIRGLLAATVYIKMITFIVRDW